MFECTAILVKKWICRVLITLWFDIVVILVVLSVAVSGCNGNHQENCHYHRYDEGCFCFLWRRIAVQEIDKPSDGEEEKTEASHAGGKPVRSFLVMVMVDFLDSTVIWFTFPPGVEFMSLK